MLNLNFYKSLISKIKTTFVLKEGVASVFLNALSTLLSFLITICLVRIMGQTNYGRYSYLYELIMIILVPAQFGLPTLLIKETAIGNQKKIWGEVKGLWKWSILINFILSAISIVFFAVVVSYNIVRITEIYKVILWGSIVILTSSYISIFVGLLKGLHKVALGLFPELLLLPSILLILVSLSDWTHAQQLMSEEVLMLLAVSGIVTLLFVIFVIIKNFPKDFHNFSSIYLPRKWLRYMVSFASISGMSIINKRIVIILLAIFVPLDQLAIYKVATQMAGLAEFGLRVINPVIQPEIAKSFSSGDHKKLQELARNSSRWTLGMNLIISLFFIIFGTFVINRIFGSEYNAAYLLMIILLIGQLINSLTGPVAMILNMTGNENQTLLARLITLLITIFLILTLAPLYRNLGAAVISGVSMTVWNCILWFIARTKLKINVLPFG